MSSKDRQQSFKSEAPRKKQVYSRNGCVACKRRKIKCDETLPTCLRCLKTNKECVYYRVFKFQNDMTTLVTPTAPFVNHTVTTIANKNSAVNNSSSAQYSTENQLQDINKPQFDPKNRIPELLNNIRASASTPASAPSSVAILPPASSIPSPEMNMTRINSETLLLNDSNEFQIDSLTDLLADQELFVGDIVRLNDSFDNKLEESIKIVEFNMNNTDYHYKNNNSAIRQSNIALNKDYEYAYNLKKSLTDAQLNDIANFLKLSPYDKVYLKSFITNVQCILFPLTNSYLDSPFINSFLSEAHKDSSLLNAMLASGARYLCEKALIDKENTPNQDKQENLMNTYKHNNAFRVHYLARCFDNLQDLLEKSDMTQNSHSALLTSLLLTADLSSNRDDKWVAHLNGAKQFINKYFKDSNREISCSLLFSKYLLSSLELSSGLWHLHSAYSSLEEFQQMFPIPLNHGPTRLLTKYGLATDSYCDDDEEKVKIAGYKLYFGYSDEALELLKEISIYQRYSEPDPFKLAHLIELVSIAKKVYIITKRPNFQIERESKYHPYYEGEDKAKMLPSSYFHMTSLEMRSYVPSQDEKDNWYSFYDYSQTVRVSSAYIFILLSKKGMNLKPDNKTVQDLINKFIESSIFYVQLKYSQITDADLEFFNDYYCSDIVIENEKDVEKLNADYFVLKESRLNELIKSQEPINHDEYVNFELDHRMCMFQWTLFVFTFAALTGPQRLILDSLLTKLISMGVKSGIEMKRKVHKSWIISRLRFHDGTKFLTMENNIESVLNDDDYSFPFS